MLATVEMCDIWTKVPVADLLLIFLNPCRHVATCRQQLGAAKANRLAWASSFFADLRMSRAISLVQTNIHHNICQDGNADPRVGNPSSMPQCNDEVGKNSQIRLL